MTLTLRFTLFYNFGRVIVIRVGILFRFYFLEKSIEEKDHDGVIHPLMTPGKVANIEKFSMKII